MSNQKTAALSFKHVTPQLIGLVETVLTEGQKHTYSVSRVYAAYNGALQKKDNPQSCSSCLRARVRELTKWYAEYRKANPAKKGEKAVEVKPEDTTEFTTANQGVDQTEDQKDGAALEAFYAAHEAKLAELGVTAESTDADLLEALEVLSTGEGVTEEEASHYGAQIEIVSARIAAATTEDQHQVTTDGALRLAEEGAQGIKFTPNEGETVKGLVEWADGTKVKPGKYPLADGRELAVQVGGKATIKEEDLT